MNKKIICLVLTIILVLGIGLFLVLRKANKLEEKNDLKITYSNEEISFKDFSDSFEKSITIKVENLCNENRTYSLEWTDVSNSLKIQNKFTYEIKCTGDRCATLLTSQVPVAGFKVFPQVLIEGGKTQTYNIEFKYNGSEKGVHFKGKLVIHSEKIEKEPESKIDEKKEKQEEEIRKTLEKERDKKSNTKA